MIEDLLARIAAFHRSRTPFPEFPMVERVVAALERAQVPNVLPVTKPLGVQKHIDDIPPTGSDESIDALLTEFKQIAHDLPWWQTDGYLDVLSDTFLDNYGYVRLVGPEPAIARAPDVRVGIAIWGPGLDYPSHNHEAEELYHVLAGEVTFRWEDGSSKKMGPGDVVHHAPWEHHAQQFWDDAAVLLYCWTGAVEADARFV